MQPSLRQLPFDDFVHVMCGALPDGISIASEVRETFSTFSDGEDLITGLSLEKGMEKLGRPVSKLMCEEIIREADLDGDGAVNMSDYCAMNNVSQR